MRLQIAAFLLLFASGAGGSVRIDSVVPATSAVAGGTEVTIRGAGFDTTCAAPRACPVQPFEVFFWDGLSAYRLQSVTVIDSETMRAVTPPHVAGQVSLVVLQLDGDSAPFPFTYTGNTDELFERILVPYFTREVHGAYGSLWVARLTARNTSDRPLPVQGLHYFIQPCDWFCIPKIPNYELDRFAPDSLLPLFPNGTAESPGVFLFVPRGRADDLAAVLRIYDWSPSVSAYGTTIPLAREHDFRATRLALLDVPSPSASVRDTLRVYAVEPGQVRVKIFHEPHGLADGFVLDLSRGSDVFHAAYGSAVLRSVPPVVSDYGPPRLRVEIEPITPGLKVWATISVTNNETQEVTVIAP